MTYTYLFFLINGSAIFFMFDSSNSENPFSFANYFGLMTVKDMQPSSHTTLIPISDLTALLW